MKSIAITLCLIGLSTTQVYAKSGRKAEKYTDKTLRCVRRIINQKRGGLQAPRIAANQLVQLQVVYADDEQVKQLYKQCKKQRRALKKSKLLPWHQLENSWRQIANEYPQNLSPVMMKLIYPTATCKLGGMNIRLGIAAMLGAGMRVGKCEADNGERFISFAPEKILGLGVGAAITAGVVEARYHMHKGIGGKKRGEFTSLRIAGGLGFALSIGPAYNRKSSVYDVGVGVGAGISLLEIGSFRPFKLLGLKDDFSEIKEHLF